MPDLCATCSNIPWEELANPTNKLSRNLPMLHRTTEEVKSSTCQTCRLFAHYIKAQELGPNSKPPYTLRMHNHVRVAEQNVGMWSIQGRQCGQFHEGPHVLFAINQPPSVHAALASPILGNISLEFVRRSIDMCMEHHNEDFTPLNAKTIRDLRVLDVERKEVVPAPAGCQYVALSYVWGRSHHSIEDARLTVSQQLPKTISDSCVVTRSLGYEYLWVDRYVRR